MLRFVSFTFKNKAHVLWVLVHLIACLRKQTRDFLQGEYPDFYCFPNTNYFNIYLIHIFNAFIYASCLEDALNPWCVPWVAWNSTLSQFRQLFKQTQFFFCLKWTNTYFHVQCIKDHLSLLLDKEMSFSQELCPRSAEDLWPLWRNPEKPFTCRLYSKFCPNFYNYNKQ